MKILTVADTPYNGFWDYYVPGKLKPYDLILSCGDLNPQYLSFLVTMARCPVMYVHGNHDECYNDTPPEGCDCIDDKFVIYKGLRILGLGGSARYHKGKHQYTERAMRRRIAKLRRKIKRHKGVDIVVTHAPPRGLGDMDDLAHRGFEAFLDFIDSYHPKYLVHGHVHMTYGHSIDRQLEYSGTHIINAYQKHEFDFPDDQIVPTKKQGDIDYSYCL